MVTWPVAGTAPSVGIDPSWKVGLHLAAYQGLSFGHDILFTFGPLGFLGHPQPYLAWTSGAALAFVGLVHFAACVGMFHLARTAMGNVAALVLVMATAFTLPWVAGWTLYGVLIFVASATAVLRRRDQPTGVTFATALGIAVGVGGLGKLSIAVVSLAIAGIGVLATARDPRRSMLGFGLSAATSFVLLWVTSGQQFADLFGYARGALEIIAGYGRSMGQFDPQSSWASGVAALATALLAGLVWLRSSNLPRRDQFALWLLLASVLFAAIKGGFTRQGVGMVIYLVTVLSLWPAFIPRKMSAVAVGMPVAGMLAMVLALTSLPISTLFDPVGRLQALAQETEIVLFERSQAALATRSGLQAQYGLPPEATAVLAGHAVDIQPWEAAVAYAYPEIRWRPQPVFQAYSAYTAYLDGQNAEFLASANAPDRILWLTAPEMGLSIDGRSVWFDAPMAKVQMVCRYLPLATGPTWQVLGRVANRCGSPVLVGSATGIAGRPVQIPRRLPPGILTVRISGIGQDLASQLVTLAYRAPAWWWRQGPSVYRVPFGVNGEPTIVAGTMDIGYMGALKLPALPETITVGPDAGAPGDGSPLEFVFEVIPILPIS